MAQMRMDKAIRVQVANASPNYKPRIPSTAIFVRTMESFSRGFQHAGVDANGRKFWKAWRKEFIDFSGTTHRFLTTPEVLGLGRWQPEEGRSGLFIVWTETQLEILTNYFKEYLT